MAVFQPHSYSRTKALNKDFAESFLELIVYLLPVYSAFEPVCEGGMTGDLISASQVTNTMLSFDQDGLVNFINFSSNLAIKRGLLFIGAGSINEFAHAFCALYENPDRQSAWIEYTEKKVSTDSVLKLSENLAAKTTFKIGGGSKYYAEPSSISDVLALMQSSCLFGMPYFCLGRGSNILVSDSGYKGLYVF